MHQATLVFQDGEEIALAVAEGQTVLESAMMADIPLRYDCTEGNCGSCVVHCVAGQTEIVRSGALPVDSQELADGLRPTCLTRLRSDARFTLPYALRNAPSSPGRQRARLIEHVRLADTVSQLVLEMDDPDAFRFQSGQYLRLRPPGIRSARAYSMASTADDLPRVELLIRHVPDGQVSQWLETAAQPGDVLTVFGPLGAFALDDAAQRHVFVAGGTGLAPVLSMIRSLHARGQPMLLSFGCTRRQELFYCEQLAALAERIVGLEVRIALMEDDGSTGILPGTAVSVLGPAEVPQGTTVYLCGPPGMVTAARRALMEWGVSPHSVRAERFQPGG